MRTLQVYQKMFHASIMRIERLGEKQGPYHNLECSELRSQVNPTVSKYTRAPLECMQLVLVA
jgi:hypothetical protein